MTFLKNVGIGVAIILGFGLLVAVGSTTLFNEDMPSMWSIEDACTSHGGMVRELGFDDEDGNSYKLCTSVDENTCNDIGGKYRQGIACTEIYLGDLTPPQCLEHCKLP